MLVVVEIVSCTCATDRDVCGKDAEPRTKGVPDDSVAAGRRCERLGAEASCEREERIEAARLRAARLALGPYAPSISVEGAIRTVDSNRAEYRPALESPRHGTMRALLCSGSVLM